MMPEVALQQIHKPHEIVLFTFGFQDSVSLIYSVEMVAHPKDKCGEQVRHDFLIPIFSLGLFRQYGDCLLYTSDAADEL